MYIDDPNIDIAVSTSPSTCSEHLDGVGRLAEIRDLNETAGSVTVYAFSVLGLEYELLAPLASELTDEHGTTLVLFLSPTMANSG